MSRKLKGTLIEQARTLVLQQGLKGHALAEALGVDERTAREYAKHVRAEAERTSANGSGRDPTSLAAPEPVMVPIDQIDLDSGTQARVWLNHEVMAEYAEAMAEGVKFPPVVLFFDGARYWVGDGFHRCNAAKKIGFISVGKLRQELSGNGYQMPEARQARRGETVYEMDTIRIGAHEATPTPANGEPSRAADPDAMPPLKTRQTVLLDPSTIAPLGSALWAEAQRQRLQAAVDRAIGGRLDFGQELIEFRQGRGWQVLTDATGEPFATFRDFALAERPHGLQLTEKAYKWLMGEEAGAEAAIQIEPLQETADSIRDFGTAPERAVKQPCAPSFDQKTDA